jgi:hypothetical protein
VDVRVLLGARPQAPVRRMRTGLLVSGDTGGKWAAMADTVWCVPDGCPASICGGPHTEVNGPGFAVIAPAGTDPEVLAGVLDYARHMYGDDAAPPEDAPEAPPGWTFAGHTDSGAQLFTAPPGTEWPDPEEDHDDDDDHPDR